jgi:crotonobetainyl-CoA:carnitine CoA-transferase CaiB-like acyl-CoA transferase
MPFPRASQALSRFTVLTRVRSGPTCVRQLADDAQVKHLGIAQHVPNDENRHIQLVGQPVTLSRTPSSMAARPPEFGEQTEQVLAEFGFGKDEIADLRQRKVV